MGMEGDPMTETGTEPLLDSLVKQATAAFGLVTTVLAGFATLSGDLPRLVRNHPWLSLTAVLLLIFALLLAAFASFNRKQSRRHANRWLKRSGWLFALSLTLGLAAAVWTSASVEQPSLSGKLISGEDGPVVEVTASGGGLQHRDRMHVTVNGYAAGEPFLLFRADVGPAADGSVALPISVPLPIGQFSAVQVAAYTGTADPDCRKTAQPGHGSLTNDDRIGCMLFHLPPPPSLPVLSAHLEGTGEDESLTVAVTAAGFMNRTLVSLRVVGVAAHRDRVIYRALLTPDISGHIGAEISVPTGGRFGTVCALAKASSADEPKAPPVRCPPAESPGLVWTMASSGVFLPPTGG